MKFAFTAPDKQQTQHPSTHHFRPSFETEADRPHCVVRTIHLRQRLGAHQLASICLDLCLGDCVREADSLLLLFLLHRPKHTLVNTVDGVSCSDPCASCASSAARGCNRPPDLRDKLDQNPYERSWIAARSGEHCAVLLTIAGAKVCNVSPAHLSPCTPLPVAIQSGKPMFAAFYEICTSSPGIRCVRALQAAVFRLSESTPIPAHILLDHTQAP